MRIKDSTLNCSIYLYSSTADAMQGIRTGGSGFVVGYPHADDPKKHHLYLVTNRHVAVNAPVVRLNRDPDGTSAIDVTDWHFHPDGDDIAVAPFEADALHKISYLSTGMFVTRKIVERYAVGPGDEVFMISRFVNHEGRQRNLPVFRQGAVAMMPHEPVKDGRGMLVEAYLVDMRSVSGHSGSPVFWNLEPLRHDPTGLRGGPVPRVQWLLGIDCGHILIPTEIYNEKGGSFTPRQFLNFNSGIAIVVPVWRIVDVLETEALERQRWISEERGRSASFEPPVTFD